MAAKTQSRKPPSTEDLVLERLDRIVRMIAVDMSKGLRQREQIALLTRAGLKPKEIAEIVGTSSNTVRVELVALRKTTKRRP